MTLAEMKQYVSKASFQRSRAEALLYASETAEPTGEGFREYLDRLYGGTIMTPLACEALVALALEG